MLMTCNLVTFLLLSLSVLYAARELALGRRSCVLILFPIHYVFCGLPLLFDLLFGSPEYLRFPGFYEAAQDETTGVVYCVYMLVCICIWWLSYSPLVQQGETRAELSRRSRFSPPRLSPSRRALFVAMLFSPFLFLAISPDPFMYLEYTPRARELHFRDAERLFHIWVGRSIQASFLASAILLFFSRRLRMAVTTMLPIVGLDCWLSGKRNAIATVLALWLYSLWRRGTLRGRPLIFSSLALAAGMILFSIYYQTQLRYTDAFVENRGRDFWYENYRIDYGRDDTIKLNILSLLSDRKLQILDYPGQSFEIIATIWIPRRFWPNKPPPYSFFVTTAAMGRPTDGGGGVTTTCLGEAVANFGWIGFLIGPILPLAVCKIGDQGRSEMSRVLTLLVAVGLQTVHIAPWAVPAAAWVFVVMRDMLTRQRPMRRRHVPSHHLRQIRPATGAGFENRPAQVSRSSPPRSE
ncbi:MAG: hypothetical protein KDA60_07270 [Planctomycetales bacterium]|nr:hypothetical protein [Planctomycetales bacterium]